MEELRTPVSLRDPDAVIVTSSLEETWPKDRPIVFLGDWCLRYSRRHVWENLNYEVASYHWDERQRIPSDLEYVRAVYEQLLGELAERLNEIHGVAYSLRYWRIVVGWWLFYFIQIYFDRWQVAQSASAEFPDSVMLRLPVTTEPPASNGMTEFQLEMATDSWNERLFADIAEQWTTIDVREVAPAVAGGQRMDRHEECPLIRPSTPMGIHGLAARMMDSLGRRGLMTGYGVSLRADYLASSEKRKLEVLLHQAPFATRHVLLPEIAPDASKRNWTLSGNEAATFERAVAAAVPAYIPTCYLEGYVNSVEASAGLGFPIDPRVIMTANAYSGDDLWKLWAASQVEVGAKLVISQHGGHYGTGRWSSTKDYETSISDRYLSWGWDDPHEPRVTPAPATKLIGVTKRPARRTGRCLQVTSALPRYSYLMYSVPAGPQTLSYVEDQFRFAGALSAQVRDELLVRLYKEDYGWDLEERWRDQEPEIAIDSGIQPIQDLLDETRLYVATYNATTFLESFTQGIPTVIFWNPHYWELADDAAPYFEALSRASVFFEDPIACAAHVNAIWDDVPAWWARDEVREAVEAFVNRFAYVGPKPLRELKDALTKW